MIVKRIIQDEMTRELELSVKSTGKTILAFDDSGLWSKNDFSFILSNHTYDVTISLFGSETPSGMKFEVVSDDRVGDVPVKVVKDNEGNSFVILSEEWEESSEPQVGDVVMFYVARYDLVRVDDVVHADYLD